jgi:hypothetical protein
MFNARETSLLAVGLMLASVLVFTPSRGAAQTGGKATTLTGVISDTMCASSHMMPGKTAAECTRACVKGGSDYALMVGKKMYTLKGNAAELDKYAGDRVTVKGAVTGNTITAQSISPAGESKGAKQ